MKNVFASDIIHRITEANINYYAVPFVHPKRKMNEHDFIYLLDGEWKFGQNEEVFTLSKDSLIILPANNMHFSIGPCSEGTKTMYFHAEANEKDLFGDLPYGINTFTDASKNKSLKKLFSNVVNYKLSGNERKADLYFELLLCELSDIYDNKSSTELAEKIKNIIHSAPERFFRNKEISEKVNVSIKTAENKFKEKFGTTIHSYALEFKINEAKNYFEMFPEISVKEVAFNLGFYDEYHFSRQFKKIVGCPPLSYKRMINNK